MKKFLYLLLIPVTVLAIGGGNRVLNFDVVNFTNEVSTPSTPSTGQNKAYFKSDAKLYILSDAATEEKVISGLADLTADVTGILPIANGGTNSSTALNNNRVMLSASGAITESGALSDGQLIIGATGAAPIPATLTGTANQVNVVNGTNSITLSTPQDLATSSNVQFAEVDLSDKIELTEISTPASPGVNDAYLYAVDQGGLTKLAMIDSAGTETILGEGGGGGLDVIYTQDHETFGVTNYTTGNNATFDNGGSLDGTLALDTSTQLADAQGFKYTMSTSSTNDWIASEAVTIGEKEQGQVIAFKFHYKYDGSDGDIEAVIWDDTNNALLTGSTATLDSTSSAKMYSVSAYIPDGVTSLKLGFHVATGNNGKILLVDDIELTHDTFNKVQIENTTDMTEYSMTIKGATSDPTKGTTTIDKAFWKRMGDHIYITYSYVQTAAGTAGSGTYYFPLPNGYIADTDKMGATNPSSTANICGSASAYDGTNDGEGVAIYDPTLGGVTLKVDIPGTGARFPSSSNWAMSNTNARYSFNCLVPILGWNSANESVVTPLTVVNPARLNANDSGTAIATSTSTFIGFSNTDFDDDGLFTNAGSGNNTTYTSTTYFTAPQDGKYRVDAQIYSTDTDLDANETARLGLAINGTQQRWSFDSVQATVASPQISWQMNDILELSKDDRVSVIFYHEAGANVNLDSSTNRSWFTVEKIDSNAKIHAQPIMQIAVIRDEKTDGTAGGTFTSGAWQTRTLNTLEGDTGFVSLSSNQFTLDPGKYFIEAQAPAYAVNSNKARLYNVTDASYDAVGTTENAVTSDAHNTHSKIEHVMEIASQKTFEIRHRGETTRSTDGFGEQASVGGNEVYTTVKIIKMQ